MPASSPNSTDICLSHYAGTEVCFVALIAGTKLTRACSFLYWILKMLQRALQPQRVWVTGRAVLELADPGCFGIDERAT